jgi:MoaA/NifB/PqqE/SkfB family radical SAM enzyme
MEQQDMSWETFTAIVKKLPRRATVKLQGEGEPTLWEHWWRGVEYLVKREHPVTTIINGTVIDTEKIPLYFKKLGVSLDSIDKVEADKVGRFNVEKVKSNILILKHLLGKGLMVHITDFGQDLKSTFAWLRENDIQYGVQSLIPKEDYVKVYPKDKIVRLHRTTLSEPMHCFYLDNETKNKFFTVKGQELPCVYIKEPLGFSRDVAIQEMNTGITPKHCTGCRHIVKKT